MKEPITSPSPKGNRTSDDIIIANAEVFQRFFLGLTIEDVAPFVFESTRRFARTVKLRFRLELSFKFVMSEV
eukprot:scaffold12701_cov40-Cyclotella_meneghiniana.AAC.1